MKKKILIINYKYKNLEFLSLTWFLKLGDFETITCSTAKGALRVIEKRYNDIAMILLDPMVPGLNTEKFLQFVKSDERCKHILVKFLPEEEITKESIERIKSMMKNESINELTIQRQYLPEIFGADLLEISKDDGLPTLEPFVKFYLLSKGISTDILGNIIKLKKVPIGFFKLVPPEPKVYHAKIPKAKWILENEYKINEYIMLKLEGKNTQLYVNGKRFLQCMRLFLQIPSQTRQLYDEVESIDEAAKVYKQSLWENRIVEDPMARPFRFQTITPEQEFWGHCSNLQAWVEHDYDTRLLMSNISFPLLRKLAEAGDPIAKKVFKEEIAQRLESGYPSVVQYLIIGGYISHFTPFEFKTIIETTNLIKNVSSQPKILSNFLQACANRFPTILRDIVPRIKTIIKTTNLIKNVSSQPKKLSNFLQMCVDCFPTILGDILLKILEFPEGKENLITASSRDSWELGFRVPLSANPRFLDKIKEALMDKLSKVRKDFLFLQKGDILDYIQIIDDNVIEKRKSNN